MDEKNRQRRKSTHAIVIGGGIAGLVTARILADHFENVSIIERDTYPERPEFRPGVPQGRQVHTTSLKGQELLETLFPGLSSKLFAQGAILQQYGYKSIYVYGGKRCPKLPPVLTGWNCSRMLLEWQILQEVMQMAQIHMMEGVEVVHLLHDSQYSEVKGVQIRSRGTAREEALQNMEADFVVDASGSMSHTVQWLKEGGYEAPQETVVDAHLGYATQIYEQPADFQEEWTGIAIQPLDENRRGGVLMRVEGKRWMVVLSGTEQDYPPTSYEEYLAFMRRLPDPVLYEAVKQAKPLTPIYGYRRTENRFRHFERLSRFPANFVVLGDAACCFNPVYGQGITAATMQALALGQCLKQTRTKQEWSDFSHLFQRTLARVVRNPWLLASTADAPKKAKPGLAGRYMACIIDLLAVDARVLQTFLEVMFLLKSPLALFQPAIVMKVLKHRGMSLGGLLRREPLLFSR